MFCSRLGRTTVLRGGAVLAAAHLPTSTSSVRTVHAQEPQAVTEEADHWTLDWKWFDKPSAHAGLRAPRWPGPDRRLSEPNFTRAEVAQRDGTGADGKIWMTYRDGVYDVTDYVKVHPGGKFILNAAGGPVDSWWAYWMQHHISPAVRDTLEKLRIGHLSDWKLEPDEERQGGGVWEEEQLDAKRLKNRHVAARISEMPYQSVSFCNALSKEYLTPSDTLFVRNHAPVPAVSREEAMEHSVAFCIGDDEVASINVGELHDRFKQNQVTTILQCTGNRAADNISCNGREHSGFRGNDEFIGLGMLGNVCWSGVRLCEVLQELVPADVRADWCTKDLLVTFEGLDGYSNSTRLSHVMNRETDCLLATEMNGEPLPPDHGFPIRIVLPGVVGARSVKWVTKVSVEPESNAPWFRNMYIDKPSMVPCHTLPLNSLILSPEPGALVDAEKTSVAIHGVAYPGGTGRSIARVEVTANRGAKWHQARCRFEELPKDDSSQPRGWVRFDVEIPLSQAHELGCGGPLTEFWCRAFDDAGNVQPPRSEPHGGYLYNGYHKVPIVRR